MAKGWLDNIEKAQTGKKVLPETESVRAKKVARKVAGATGVGLVLDQFPGAETAYDAYNVIDAYRQGDPMKVLPNMMGALIPGTAGKAFEAVTDEYLPKTPEKEKEKMKAVLKGKRATPEQMRKAQESVDWSGGFKKLYNDVSDGLKNSIDDVVTPLMGLKNGGWLDNYNDYQTSAPEGFEGDGYSNVGRNSSPAWGGQFQMGGVLPGAVGHMYARTGAPSEGKYAKKTLPSAQNGQEMQYYREGLDWKPKTISQDGTKVDYHTGDKVTYGTPEYKEAHNRGEVVTDQGEYSPIALDEVIIQNNYKRPRGFWEQYRDKIVEENKDSGVLGAIIGTPISAITSLPQLAMMKGFTGEMQRPSEALDIQNPYGAMAVDAIADPANLTGAGILTKENTFAKLKNIPTSVSPELRQGLHTQGLGDMINDIKLFTNKKFIPGVKTRHLPETLVPNVEYNPLRGTHTKITLNDPKGEIFGYLGLENKTNWIRDNEGRFTYDDRGIPIKGDPEWVRPSMISVSPKLQGNKTQDLLYQLGIEEANKKGMKGVYSGETLLSPAKTKKAHERFNREIFETKATRPRPGEELVEHDIVGLTGHTNPNIVNDWMENYKNIDKFSRQHYSIRDVATAPINYVKKYPKDALAMGLGASTVGGIGWAFNELNNLNEEREKETKEYIKKMKEYSKKTKNKKKEGGIIKDDRGQWAHPGEITEINSNDITMEGVPYDVLGISDIGDTKLMKPGMNYKFKGKKVTEYPMAKNGVNQQDQKTLQHVNQLTNFTNYNKPTIGGWLNKYN